jgi:hypothetical protein
METDAETRATIEEHLDYVMEEALAEAVVFGAAPSTAAVLAVELDNARATLGVRVTEAS